MPKALLIPGFATRLTGPYRAPRVYGGFLAFEEDVKNGQAAVFEWGISRQFSHFQSYNPFSYIRLYLTEKGLISTPEFLKELDESVQKNRPQVIIVHSLATLMVLHYFEQYGVPKFVKTLVLLQPDASLQDFEKLKKITPDMKIIHVYRPDDHMLWLGSLIHRGRRIGLMKMTGENVTNIKFQTFAHLHLHNAVLHDKEIKKHLNEYL